MNQLSIQLSNEAMARGLALADQHGSASLQGLIEHLLLTSPAVTPPSTARTVPVDTAVDEPPPATDHGQEPSKAGEFQSNLPALTLGRPAGRADNLPAASADDAAQLPLPFLTNRLSPLKAAVRALANLAARESAWPRLRDFQAEAGHAARERGLALQAEDRAAGRRGRQKRSVAWPVGANPASALDRYVFSFTLGQEGGRPSGPLATLGLAGLVDGRAALTAAGWELALADSPLLDGTAGSTLGATEVQLLRRCLSGSSAEREATTEFIRAVKRAAGAQPRIDELLASWHADWSADQAAAQRSAMIGRLEELGAIEVSGRGGKATVTLVDVEDLDDATTERNAA